MKINSKQFRSRYNIAPSTEAKLKKDKKVPYELVNEQTVYDQNTTDKLALEKKLTRNAFIAINNIIENDHTEEHY